MGRTSGNVSGLLPFPSGFLPHPGDHPDDMHGRRREELLQMHPCEAKVPALAEIEAPDAWRGLLVRRLDIAYRFPVGMAKFLALRGDDARLSQRP